MNLSKSKKFQRLNPTGSMISKELVHNASKADDWRSTILGFGNHLEQPEKFLDPEFLERVSEFFSAESAEIPEGLTAVGEIVEEFSEGGKALYNNADSALRSDINSLLNLTRLQGIGELLKGTKVNRYAIDAYILSKVLSVLNANYQNLLKILTEANENDMMSEELVAALADLGVGEKEEETSTKNYNLKFQNKKSVPQTSGSEDEENVFSSKFNREKKKSSTFGGFGKKSLSGKKKTFFGGEDLNEDFEIFSTGKGFGGSKFGSGRAGSSFGKKTLGKPSFGSGLGSGSKSSPFGKKTLGGGKTFGSPSKKNPFKR